jgi:hypothetical protein
MSTLQNNRRIYSLLNTAVLVLLLSLAVQAQDMAWPQFRGPESNPVGTHPRLADVGPKRKTWSGRWMCPGVGGRRPS